MHTPACRGTHSTHLVLWRRAQKDTFRTDSELERKLCVAVLAQLDDVSGDISGLAVKW